MPNTPPLLNENQLEAIEYDNGPLLIIAGAGSGKTTVVTQRISHLILKKNVNPTEILALTFTDKAAREMEERVDVAMPYGYTQLWISTFHAFCDRILRSEAIHIGLNPAYRLLSESETVLLMRQNIFKFNLQYFRPLGNPNKFLEGLIQHFSRLRDEDISPNQYFDWAQAQSSKRKAQNEEPENNELEKNLELAHAYQTYQDLKAKEGVVDYADLITHTLTLFRTRKNVLRNYQTQFKYVLVDEFQDTNFAQNQLAILLADKHKNITVVGDDDQAIYRWRGAAISNMVQFRSHFPTVKVVTLSQNYRSTQMVLDHAHTLIQHNNPDRLEVQEQVNKKLVAMRKAKSYPVEFFYEERVEDEADATTKKIQELVTKHKYQYKDIAILIRANDHAVPFVKALGRHSIPYQFLGPGRLFRQEEIKDLIAYLKVLANFEDSTSLYRVLNLPIFQIDTRDIAAFLNFAKRRNLSLFEVLEYITYTAEEETEIRIAQKTAEIVKTVVAMIKRHLERVPKESAGQILYYFLQDTGILSQFLSPKTETETKQYQNIATFFDKLKSFEAQHEDAKIFPVVEWIDLSMQMGESPLASDTDWTENNAVNLLTIHSSKGLEFPVVFLVNLVSQRFPTRERKEQIPIPVELIKEILPSGDYHLQEERRLFYVGITRARDRLYLTAANFYGEGKRERKISPFVYETLGEDNLKTLIKKQKETKTFVQPSLLDWAESFQTEKKETNQLASVRQAQDKNDKWKMVNNPITYLSYSQMQTFEMCPLHYKLQYILKVPSVPNPALSFGSSVHAALRDYYQQIIMQQTTKPEDILPMLEKNWITSGYDSKEHQKQALERAKYVVQKYIQSDSSHPSQPISVETPFQFILHNNSVRPSSLKVAGRIDRVDLLADNRIEIIDYKTGTNKPTEKEMETNLQLTFYALAATKVHDKLFNKKPEEVVLSLYYLEEDIKLTTTRTKEQLEEAEIKILQKVVEMEQSDYTCSGNIFCHNCEYKMLCRV